MGEAAKKLHSIDTVVKDVRIGPVEANFRGLQVGPADNLLKRFLAQLIDLCLIVCVTIPVYSIQIFAYPLLLVSFDIPQTETIVLAETVFSILVSFFFVISYYYFFYRYKCTTIGKRIFDYRVYKYHSCEPIGFFKIINREIIGKTLSISLLPITLILYLTNKEKLLLHDYLANTQVIEEDTSNYFTD